MGYLMKDKEWEETKDRVAGGLSPSDEAMVRGILDKHRDLFKDKDEERYNDAMKGIQG